MLETSLVEPKNGYSQLRLARYALEDAAGPLEWDALPEWNPSVRPVVADDFGRFDRDPLRPSRAGEGDVLSPLLDVSAGVASAAELIDLGRRAFEAWPAQREPPIAEALRSPEAARRFGVWVDDRSRVGGFVRVAMADGSEHFALTCASCHARTDASGRLSPGAANVEFDLGALKYSSPALVPSPELEALAEWGPGRVDVTSDGAHNPAAISDLRAVRLQRALHWTGSVRNSLPALAVRIETLLVTSTGETLRPPRRVAVALAVYLWTLSDPDAVRPPLGSGREFFAGNCAGCHHADGGSAGWVPLDAIGTDPLVGTSDRWTGAYRIPSLWGVADRPRLLHDASVAGLEHLLDPARLDTTPGHVAGTRLSEAERAELIGFVRGIGAP